MYYAAFGLRHPPFKITPDTRLFFPGGNRGAVLEALVYAIVSGEGIVKVVGEVGSGKTMLCRMLEVELPENVEIVYLANPSLAPDQILHAIAFELKLPGDGTEDRLKVMHALHEFLVRKHAENRRVVVFVEEAQSMPIETLEEIRLLSNLETNDDKLLQIVLFGQPELDVSLAEPRIRQLKERITYSFYLSPLSTDEVQSYLESRLRASGYRGVGLFTPAAIRSIGRYSRGLTRRINILADKALLAAFAGNAVAVTRRHVRRAARDSEFAGRRARGYRTVAIAWGLLLVATIPLGMLANHILRSGARDADTKAQVGVFGSHTIERREHDTGATKDGTGVSGAPARHGSLEAPMIASDQRKSFKSLAPGKAPKSERRAPRSHADVAGKLLGETP